MARPVDLSLIPRNHEMAAQFKAGARVCDLAARYCLTRQSVRHILRGLGVQAAEGGVAVSSSNLVGQVFDRLTVLRGIDGRGRWECRCACGSTVVVKTNGLTSGNHRSCGCWRRDMQDAMRISRRGPGWTPDGRHTLTYRIWALMKSRCLSPTSPSFKYYGERGIAVCDRWQKSYAHFLADMGECPAGMEIDRIDVDGNYEPGNCRWATDSEQANNTRSNRITPSGMTVAQAARHEGISYGAAYHKYVTIGRAPWRSKIRPRWQIVARRDSYPIGSPERAICDWVLGLA